MLVTRISTLKRFDGEYHTSGRQVDISLKTKKSLLKEHMGDYLLVSWSLKGTTDVIFDFSQLEPQIPYNMALDYITIVSKISSQNSCSHQYQ